MRRLRNTDSPGDQESAILKAAAEEVAIVGLGRLSMDVAARQAGVSRSTLYRRFPNRDALITALGRRTFDFAMTRLQTVGIGDSPRAAAVAAFREGVRLLTSEPVMRRFLQLDSDFTATSAMIDDARVFLVGAATAMATAAGCRCRDARRPAAGGGRAAHPNGGLAGPGWHAGARCDRRRRGHRICLDLSGTARTSMLEL